MRKKKGKAATSQAEAIVLKKLHAYDVSTAVKMLEASIENSWTGVFPLKTEMAFQSKPRYMDKEARQRQLEDEIRAKY